MVIDLCVENALVPPDYLFDIMYVNYYAVKSTEDFRRRQEHAALIGEPESSAVLESIDNAAVNTCPTLQMPTKPFSHHPYENIKIIDRFTGFP